MKNTFLTILAAVASLFALQASAVETMQIASAAD